MIITTIKIIFNKLNYNSNLNNNTVHGMNIFKSKIIFFSEMVISIKPIHFLIYKTLPNTKNYYISDDSTWNKRNLISFIISKFARLNHPQKVIKKIVLHDKRLIKLNLDITEFTSCGYYFGLFSKPLLKLITFNKGGTFIDIGANIGFYSLVASNYFDHVYSFEPVSLNYEKLTMNIKKNNIKNILPIKKALGEKKAEMMIFLNPYNAGGNSLLDKSVKSWRNSNFKEKVFVVPLDQAKKFKDVKLIKIDVEGFEEFVIKGGIKLLKKQMPIIFLEVNKDINKAKRILALCPKDYTFFNSKGTNVIEDDMIYCHKSESTSLKNLLLSS